MELDPARGGWTMAPSAAQGLCYGLAIIGRQHGHVYCALAAEASVKAEQGRRMGK
jgi:hypothetical protein